MSVLWLIFVAFARYIATSTAFTIPPATNSVFASENSTISGYCHQTVTLFLDNTIRQSTAAAFRPPPLGGIARCLIILGNLSLFLC
jgi:hypothetical protein